MHSNPTVLLRLEGAVVLLLSFVLYARLGEGWLLFAVLFLTPDLTMIGYVRGTRVGAIVYNAGHTYVGSLILGAIGLFLGNPLLIALALIWTAHIGFDRALGYGLKSTLGFHETHLGRIGRTQRVHESG